MREVISGPFDPLFLLAPPILGAIGVILGYTSIRILTPSKTGAKRLLWFWFLLVTGGGYLVVWQEPIGNLLHWEPAWILLVILWCVGIGFLFWRGRSKVSSEATPQQGQPKRDPWTVPIFVALLFSLVAMLVEWELTIKGQGRVAIAVFWTVASILGVVQTWRSRKPILTVVLRTMFVLVLLGAIGQRTREAGIAVIVFGGIWLLAERFNAVRRNGQSL